MENREIQNGGYLITGMVGVEVLLVSRVEAHRCTFILVVNLCLTKRGKVCTILSKSYLVNSFKKLCIRFSLLDVLTACFHTVSFVSQLFSGIL